MDARRQPARRQRYQQRRARPGQHFSGRREHHQPLRDSPACCLCQRSPANIISASTCQQHSYHRQQGCPQRRYQPDRSQYIAAQIREPRQPVTTLREEIQYLTDTLRAFISSTFRRTQHFVGTLEDLSIRISRLDVQVCQLTSDVRAQMTQQLHKCSCKVMEEKKTAPASEFAA